jgi:hypothetical protein
VEGEQGMQRSGGMDRAGMAPGAVLYELDKLWVPLCEVDTRWFPRLDDTQ